MNELDPIGLGVTEAGELVLLHHNHAGHMDVSGRPICSACVIQSLRNQVSFLRVASRPQASNPGEVPS